ncbi:MAG TPA: endonuclease/exonuclease/phosphatase family protein [Bacteroidota bacterium]|nr:endonuclease/exonuclease/phosphatase family protein [Bacteroidota bacterium]
MIRLRLIVSQILRLAAWVVGSAVTVVSVISIFDHLGVIPPESVFFVADFISPLWLLLLFIAASILALLGGSRLFWIPASLGMLLFFLFGDVSLAALGPILTRQDAAPKKTIRVVTLNVEYYADGVDKVMDAIDRLDVDVTLLGEHVLSPAQSELMRNRLNGRTLIAGHPNSTAILSRLPVIWWREVELPSHEASLSGGNDPDEIIKRPHRSFIHAVVRSDSQDVHVISIRFIAGRPKDHSLRENLRWGRFMFREQLKESEFFAHYVSGLKGPVIFGGDLNACPSSMTVSRIRRVATDAYLEHNFFGDMTFRTEFPTMRIDYLFCMNGVRSVAASRPRIIVSDHFPVLGSFALQSPGRSDGSLTIPAPNGGLTVKDVPQDPLLSR